jgi:ribosomal protein S18 acetylase RimI-like enzyme
MQLQALTGSHDRQRFDCGRPELNDRLRRVARQHRDKGLSKTYVVIREDEPNHILGYYALSLTELDKSDLPSDVGHRFPRRIPGIRLGRLAVDVEFQHRGLGKIMLVDAMIRARRIHVEADGIGLFVDAKDEPAAAWYRYFRFVSLPDRPLMLFYPVKELEGE